MSESIMGIVSPMNSAMLYRRYAPPACLHQSIGVGKWQSCIEHAQCGQPPRHACISATCIEALISRVESSACLKSPAETSASMYSKQSTSDVQIPRKKLSDDYLYQEAPEAIVCTEEPEANTIRAAPPNLRQQ
jgi:hypothetical protein